MNGIIYVATCTVNGKRYVGQTIRSLKHRRKEHFNSKALCPFSRAIRKHGRDSFTWELLHEGVQTMDDLNRLEAETIVLLDSMNKTRGYNCISGGGQGGTPCAETRAKISAANTGKVRSAETRARISAGNSGKVRSAEHRAKVGAANAVRVFSAEARAKLREAQQNIPAEHRAKISANQKKRFADPEVRAQVRATRNAYIARQRELRSEND